MANSIQLLPDVIASQIAAGEVVQRPASVVKELLENAIDAGATKIQLSVKDSGKTLIQVVDNGIGMSAIDARMSIERHATSKIRKAEDLFRIQTLGFRGEALASITAVAMVDLISKQEEDEVAVHLKINGGEVESQDFIAAQTGTTIKVKHLFYNIPARRKFLKSDSVELKHIFDEFQRIAIPHPNIQFIFSHNGKEQYHLVKGNLRQRVASVLGKNANQRLVPIDEHTELVHIRGFVGKPEFARKTRGDQFFFVNNRFFKSPYLHHAVMSAYENLIPAGTYPTYTIFLDIDPEFIDVNVHPTKQEIKFENERLIYNYLKVTIRHALGKYGVIPGLDFDQDPVFNTSQTRPSSKTNYGGTPIEAFKPATDDWKNLFEHVKTDTQEVEQAMLTIDPEWDSSKKDDARVESGDPVQILNRYVLSPLKNGFILIDQYSALTRIHYERFLATYQQPGGKQQLLFPETIHFNQSESQAIEEALEFIHAIGFEIGSLGNNSYILQAVPVVFENLTSPLDILKTLAEEITHNRSEIQDLKDWIARFLAQAASSHSWSRALSVEEMRALIDQLFGCKEPYRTPSGKLCFIQYDGFQIEKLFNA